MLTLNICRKMPDEQDPQPLIDKNRESLLSHATTLLQRLASEDKISQIPREIRYTSLFVYIYSYSLFVLLHILLLLFLSFFFF